MLVSHWLKMPFPTHRYILSLLPRGGWNSPHGSRLFYKYCSSDTPVWTSTLSFTLTKSEWDRWKSTCLGGDLDYFFLCWLHWLLPFWTSDLQHGLARGSPGKDMAIAPSTLEVARIHNESTPDCTLGSIWSALSFSAPATMLCNVCPLLRGRKSTKVMRSTLGLRLERVVSGTCPILQRGRWFYGGSLFSPHYHCIYCK